MIKLSIRLLTPLLMTVWFTGTQAQGIAEARMVEITFSKTSSLVFNTSIVSVDRGSRDVLAQKAPGVQNILQLKAARKDFPETNLTVITSDGVLHQFTVTYARQPRKLASMVDTVHKSEDVPVIFTTEMTEPEMEQYCESIAGSKRFVRRVNDRSHKMSLSLRGIYCKEDMMFLRLEIKNRSNINYDADYTRMFIRDSKTTKRTSSQELSVNPVFVNGDDKRVQSKSRHTIIYAVSKFTIPDAKKFYIEVMEQSGGRHLKLSIKNKTIVNARPIPQ